MLAGPLVDIGLGIGLAGFGLFPIVRLVGGGFVRGF
jgi:hypothetical protein